MPTSLVSGTYKVRVGAIEWAMEVDMRSNSPWLRFRLPAGDQTISLTMVPRHFGGHRWYFLCPMTGKRASVLWMPPGQRFASQRYWREERRALYRSQGMSRYDRADKGSQRIAARLINSQDGNMLYKPKWMRWRTFNRLSERLDAYENVLDEKLLRCVAHVLRVAG
jgi:hypothetical protein